MNVPQRSLGIGVERLGVRQLSGEVRVDRGDEARAELTHHHTPKAGLGKRRRAERDERLGARLTEGVRWRSLSTGPASPVYRASADIAAGPATCAGRPTALRDGRDSRPRSGAAGTRGPGLRGSTIDRRPLRRELRPPLEAPVAEGLGDVLPGLLAAQILEEPAPDDLGDLGPIRSLATRRTTFEILSCQSLSQSVNSTWLRGRLITVAPCVVPVVATVRF